ncbi:FGGY-family carbohydrate kinase [Arcanobacterium buesumense]|uniref:Sugar kinase n=1 Tax=Arcanobacterium buesumense TaxID=2722751 RepID=A0A6H2EM19_9ACTO|nr:FGGY family carbohydrate kinase [Arcanobacterium buesumense]QJC22120.1 sugar kinase [Arcanobacterium buesumense]
MNNVLTLGIDIGTGATKAVLCDHMGAIVAQAVHPNTMSLPRPGFAEMDAVTDWWGSVLHVCRHIVNSDGYADIAKGEAKLGALCVSGLGPALVTTVSESSTHKDPDAPLHKAILYGIDTRAEKQIQEQNQILGREAILARCGKTLSSQSLGPKIAWVRDNYPEVSPDSPWYSSHSYIVKRLTGQWVLDHHTASQCDPLYDVQKQDWAYDWAERILPGLHLPKLLWPGELAGQITACAADETGLPEGTQVLAGTIDAWAEAYSAGVSAPGDLMLMYGSTMFMVQVLAAPTVSPALWTTSGVVPHSHTLAAGMATSGSVTTWFQGLCGGIDFKTLIDEAKSIAPGADGLVLLPYFAGERTPLYDPDARGMVVGLTLRHQRGHIFRAVYEGIAFGIRQIIEELEMSAGRPARILAVGGGTQGRLWAQIVSDVCSIEQIIPDVTVGASYGDALLAAQYLGSVSQKDTWVKESQVVKPNVDITSIYDELYNIYLDSYLANKTIMHRLSAIQNM